MTQPSRMRSTRRRAFFWVLPMSKASQSPSQKSNWWYSGAEQGAGVEDRRGGAERTGMIAIVVKRSAREMTPILKHRAIVFIGDTRLKNWLKKVDLDCPTTVSIL